MTNVSEIRVRYSETDQMGVVYYSNYFVWMEVGRTNLLRDVGLTYKEMEEKGIALPVAKAFAKYIAPAFYDDLITIHSTITSLSNIRIRIDYRIFRVDKLLCTGFTEHAFISIKDKKVIKIPDFFKERVKIPDNVEDYITKI